MTTLRALCIAYFKNVVAGFIGIILIRLFFWTAQGESENFFETLFLIGLNFFLSFVFIFVFLLPLSIIQKERIKEEGAIELFKRYLPLLTMLGIILGCLIFSISNPVESKDYIERYGFIIVPQLLLVQASVGLWTFLKKLKS
jgi:hypothetical protein